MSYTLDQFASDCREAIETTPGKAGREQIVEHVKTALKDATFIETWLDNQDDERRVIYEDAEHGFCICAHVYNGAARGKPHDHGPTWAIYGQAAGETEMTDWKVVKEGSADTPKEVELARTYTLRPGDAHLYEPGDIHAPLRDAPTRLIRVEGTNTENITRTKIIEAG